MQWPSNSQCSEWRLRPKDNLDSWGTCRARVAIASVSRGSANDDYNDDEIKLSRARYLRERQRLVASLAVQQRAKGE